MERFFKETPTSGALGKKTKVSQKRKKCQGFSRTLKQTNLIVSQKIPFFGASGSGTLFSSGIRASA